MEVSSLTNKCSFIHKTQCQRLKIYCKNNDVTKREVGECLERSPENSIRSLDVFPVEIYLTLS